MKIISGGQTGVGRAALDVAIELGLPCGGWCPRGRRAEDGRIPDRYPLSENYTPHYKDRAARNVAESDATLILTRGPRTDGTALTKRLAVRSGKPFLVVDPTRTDSVVVDVVRRWLTDRRVNVLNVAGPRESSKPGIGDEARAFLRLVLRS